ncbi:uridine kinase-like protein 3 [Humulus lupulus]|uniref:uridine kinase-like protein 3 n=1 Tax=Humulus lupulus TaxID=3486 RepID=UPI002B407033|nr:uridine kinase-like protein 3 [Humulus lupulus]
MLIENLGFGILKNGFAISFSSCNSEKPVSDLLWMLIQVVEHGLGHFPFTEKQVVTPTESVYTGVDFCKRLCGVSIIRSGESMENALRACCKGINIGKILIHRKGDNGQQIKNSQARSMKFLDELTADLEH